MVAQEIKSLVQVQGRKILEVLIEHAKRAPSWLGQYCNSVSNLPTEVP